MKCYGLTLDLSNCTVKVDTEEASDRSVADSITSAHRNPNTSASRLFDKAILAILPSEIKSHERGTTLLRMVHN